MQQLNREQDTPSMQCILDYMGVVQLTEDTDLRHEGGQIFLAEFLLRNNLNSCALTRTLFVFIKGKNTWIIILIDV
jgi:hypothetical protein